MPRPLPLVTALAIAMLLSPSRPRAQSGAAGAAGAAGATGTAARALAIPDGTDAVAARVRVHDDDGARRLLDTLERTHPDSVALAYLRARLDERLGDVREASDHYARVNVAALPEALRDDTRLRAARMDARAGRCARARPRLLELAASGGPAAPLAQVLAAECALALGDHSTAVTELSAALSASRRQQDANDAGAMANVDGLAVARQLARSLRALGRSAEAASTLREAYLRAPTHPDAEGTLAALVALDPSAANFDRATRIALVARHVAARQYEQALVIAESLGVPQGGGDRAERAAALHLRGEVLFAMRTRYAESARAFDEARLLGGETAVDDEFFAARATSRAGHDAAAVQLYDAFAVDHPSDARAREAVWLAAWLELRAGGPVRVAQRRMRDFVLHASAREDRARATDGAFLLAMDWLERADANAALPWLERACTRPSGDLEILRCRYWTATTNLMLETPAAVEPALTNLRRLALAEPFEWYGLLARARLVARGRPAEPTALIRATSSAEPLTLPPEVALLESLGLVDEAARRLVGHERALRREPLGLERLVATYGRLGDAARAFRLARTGGGEGYFFAMQHPQPYEPDVTSLAARIGVDPSYVYGTMRQESGFDATAVSRVGAIGLLQLMEPTARRAAESAGVERFEPSVLFDPRMNVRLGMVEMSQLGARYDGSIAFIAAAYNAGSAKVDAWRQARPELPLDLFVERIPFDETRGYVRRVVSHTARYRALSGHPELTWELIGIRLGSSNRMR